MQTAGSLIKKTFGSDKDELKEKESGKERHREEGEKEKEKEGPEAGIESDEEEETHSALETEYPDMLMVLPAEDFEVKDYGVKEDDSKAEKFLRKKIGTTLDNAKVYKKRYDGFDKKKKVVATIGSPILSTAISIRSSFEDPKTRAELLERRLKGLLCVQSNNTNLGSRWINLTPALLCSRGVPLSSGSLTEVGVRVGGAEKKSIISQRTSSGEIEVGRGGSPGGSIIESGWRKNTIYKQHPYRPGYYMPLEEFHDEVAQEKVKEFIDIMISLGAKSIHFSKSNLVQGKEEMQFSAQHRFIPGAKIDVKGETYQKIKKFCEIDIEMERPEGDAPIFDPEGRGFVWYQSEPTWSSIIESRVRNPNVHKLAVSLSNTNDYGTSGIEAKVRLLPGVKVGGGGSVFIQSEHIYKVRFFTQKDYTRFKSMAPPPQLAPTIHTTPLIEEVTEEVNPPSSPQLSTTTPSPPQPSPEPIKEEDLAISSKEKKVPPPRPPLPQNYVPSKAKEPEKTG